MAKNHIELQNRYDRDAEGRVIARTTFAWDGDDWQPALRWSYSYTATGYVMTFARYDSQHKCFEAPTTKTIYVFSPDSSVAFVSTYTRSADDYYELTDSWLAAFPDKTPMTDLIAVNQ